MLMLSHLRSADMTPTVKQYALSSADKKRKADNDAAKALDLIRAAILHAKLKLTWRISAPASSQECGRCRWRCISRRRDETAGRGS